VSPLLDSIGSVKGFGFGALLSTFQPTGSYDALASYTVPSGGVSSVTFSVAGLTGYQHLQIRGIGRTTSSGADNAILVTLNGDTGANYSYHTLFGNGSSPVAFAATNTNGLQMDKLSTNTNSTNVFGGAVFDLLDYASTTKFKTSRSLGGRDNNGAGGIFLSSGAWRNLAAVTTLTLTPYEGYNFTQFSQFALYGVK
jgi:hypothetical protein